MAIEIVPGVSFDPLGAGCELFPPGALERLKAIVGALLIIGACYTALRSIMAGFSYQAAGIGGG